MANAVPGRGTTSRSSGSTTTRETGALRRWSPPGPLSRIPGHQPRSAGDVRGHPARRPAAEGLLGEWAGPVAEDTLLLVRLDDGEVALDATFRVTAEMSRCERLATARALGMPYASLVQGFPFTRIEPRTERLGDDDVGEKIPYRIDRGRDRVPCDRDGEVGDRPGPAGDSHEAGAQRKGPLRGSRSPSLNRDRRREPRRSPSPTASCFATARNCSGRSMIPPPTRS